jgi:hypothetical protein
MGLGGYKTAAPKWDMEEATMREKGIVPETHNCPIRSRNWILGHGVRYDPKIGKLTEKKEISKPVTALVTTITEVRVGKFHPDKKNDKLTKAPMNPEHTGQTRGMGAATPWRTRFADDSESYRSKERARKQKAQEEADRLQSQEMQHKELRDMYLQ